MGTLATLCLPGDGHPAATAAVARVLRGLERRLTVNGPPEVLRHSQVEAVNAAAGQSAVVLDPDVYEVVEAAVLASRAHRGSFNALIGPVVKAWRIGFDDARVPSGDELARLLELTDPAAVDLDPDARTVRLTRPGMRLDLGAIAKGYAAAVAAAVYRAQGVSSGLVDLGGNVVAIGAAEGGRPWRVGVQAPFEARGTPLGHLDLVDASAVTSGVYERVLEVGGHRYHHMIDPLTGQPFDTDLASVTIVSASSLEADVWATVAQRGGLAGGVAAIADGPGLAAVLVTRDGGVVATTGASERFTLTHKACRLLEAPGTGPAQGAHM
jgi:thiamine biosynthesis lipoprotein